MVLAAKLTDSHRGMVVTQDAQLTVGAYLTSWLETVARHRIRVTTHTNYEGLVRRYLVPGLGHRKLGTLTVKDVRVFLDRLATVCQCCAWGWDAQKNPADPVKARRPRCCSIGEYCNKTVSTPLRSPHPGAHQRRPGLPTHQNLPVRAQDRATA